MRIVISKKLSFGFGETTRASRREVLGGSEEDIGGMGNMIVLCCHCRWGGFWGLWGFGSPKTHPAISQHPS